ARGGRADGRRAGAVVRGDRLGGAAGPREGRAAARRRGGALPRAIGSPPVSARTAPRPVGILFDMDGVLVESTETWFRAVEEAGRRFRGRPITREEFLPTFGQGAEGDVEVFGLSCTPEALDAFYLAYFVEHAAGSIWVDPSAAQVLRALKDRGIRRSVVTNTMALLAERILRAAD